ncbi:MAG: peptide chain release factor N(5)-glutamine methyltransferase [Rhodomicrobium sp.]
MLDLSAPDGHAVDGRATLGGAVRKLAALFREAGLPGPQLDARILAAQACGLTPEDLILKSSALLSAGQERAIASIAARRLAREPVSRIIGRREFWGLTFAISPDTLDPRPETELLAEAVLGFAKAEGLAHAPLRILDLGTGSGCLLGALLAGLPQCYGVGLDRSEAALTVARNNLSRLGLLDRAAFLCADWMSAIGGAAFDAIVCNPPYIAPSEICQLEPEVKGYDPYLALNGGEDGLEPYRTIVPQAYAALRKGGLLIVEIGHRQGEAVLDLMKQSALHPGFPGAQILTDMGGTDRAVAGVRQS